MEMGLRCNFITSYNFGNLLKGASDDFRKKFKFRSTPTKVS